MSNPMRSPLAPGGAAPAFARGEFIGSPLAYDDDDEDEHDDFGSDDEWAGSEGGAVLEDADNFDEEDREEEEEEGGIEIMETIPASWEAIQAHHAALAAREAEGEQQQQGQGQGLHRERRDQAEHAREDHAQEERGSTTLRKPKLRLKLTDSLDGGSLLASSSAMAINGAPAVAMSASPYSDSPSSSASASPRNQNVFNLRLKHLSMDADGDAEGYGDDLTNTADSSGGIQMLRSSTAGGQKLHASTAQAASDLAAANAAAAAAAASSAAGLNDSLTSSGRLALANFHATQAALASKRAPHIQAAARQAALQQQQQLHAAGGGKRGVGGGRGTMGKHRVNESYDVSKHGTLLLDGFEIGSTGVQRTPLVPAHAHGPGHETEDELSMSMSASSAGHATLLAASAAVEAAKAARRGREGESGGGARSNGTAGSGNNGNSSRGASASDSLSLPASSSAAGGGASKPGSRRPSAIVQKFLEPIPGTTGGGAHGDSVSPAPTVKTAGLGVEFRLYDMVRMGDLGVGQNGTVCKACYLPALRIVALKTCTVFDRDERHQLVKELRAFNACSSAGCVSSLLDPLLLVASAPAITRGCL